MELQPTNKRKSRFVLLPPMEAAFVLQCQATRHTLYTLARGLQPPSSAFCQVLSEKSNCLNAQ